MTPEQLYKWYELIRSFRPDGSLWSFWNSRTKQYDIVLPGEQPPSNFGGNAITDGYSEISDFQTEVDPLGSLNPALGPVQDQGNQAQPPTTKCGLNITKQLRTLLNRIKKALEADIDLYRNICNGILRVGDYIEKGWDINELKLPFDRFVDNDNNCGTGAAKNTAEVEGGCFRVEGINYVLWGFVSRMCHRDLSTAEAAVKAYRLIADLIPGADNAGLDVRLAWTYMGWNFSLKWKDPEVVPGKLPGDFGSVEFRDQWVARYKKALLPFPSCGKDFKDKLNGQLLDVNGVMHRWASD